MYTASYPYPLFNGFVYRNNRPINQPAFHSHSQYEIYYFHSGKCSYLLGDKVIDLVPGDFILMNGMTPHCPRTDLNVEYVRSNFLFDPSFIQILEEKPRNINLLKPFQVLRNHHLRLDGERKTEMEQLLERINNLYRKNDLFSYHKLRLAFIELLLLIYEMCQEEMAKQEELPQEKERTVQNILSFIESRYTESIHLEQLEAELHMSKYYLARLFREVTGQTIFTYLYQRRINQAKMLFMLDQGQSVTQVGYLVGFKHPAHFSRLFKQQVGMTPDQYRKSIK
ncbi:AraC family transcriptional regulator [Paenibacillus sp. J2TS4]|uniref:AraC family transcriptional regulator n=1 Tax=Paenibacillus sp. J2TS4 TaxID=2807194 RepID=UPI001B2E76CC|nr:AraC family transcriptional regulator [Paenibacillus sp. J2TS4]GIP33892.1 AraC family transcriptional regulator [Paenibacillus sp. J2TS4]